MIVDQYRVLLFKKKLREIIGAPWLRFYWSKGKCHICFRLNDFRPDDRLEVIEILRRAQIQIKVNEWGDWVHSVSIPIDQDALPERKKVARRSNWALERDLLFST